jgi:flagellar assembly factor FliW
MPDKHGFFVTEFPSGTLRKFKLLQSLDDYGLSFITLPAGLRNGIVAAEDLAFACKELGIAVENLAALLIVSVHRSPDRITLSVNARAPLLIDSRLKLAAQYVFQTDKYKVQHIITL